MAQSEFGKSGNARDGTLLGSGSARLYVALSWVFLVAGLTTAGGVIAGLLFPSIVPDLLMATGAVVATTTLVAGKALTKPSWECRGPICRQSCSGAHWPGAASGSGPPSRSCP